jgi:hypothetical protein
MKRYFIQPFFKTTNTGIVNVHSHREGDLINCEIFLLHIAMQSFLSNIMDLDDGMK